MNRNWTRRTFMTFLSGALAMPPGRARASDECTFSRESGPWKTEIRIHAGSHRDGIATSIEETIVAHSFHYGKVDGGNQIVRRPELGFHLKGRYRANKAISSRIDVTPLSYVSNARVELPSNRKTPDTMAYWPSAINNGTGVRMAPAYEPGDRPYIQFTGANGKVIRSIGEFSFARIYTDTKTTLHSKKNERELVVNCEHSDPSITNEIAYLLRKFSHVTVETGIVSANEQIIPFQSQRISTAGVDALYTTALKQLNNEEYTLDLTACASDCFLMTACCAVLQRPDNCFELQTLRKFRDGWLQRQSFGPEDIKEYYRTAPHISRTLLSSKSGRAKLRALYWKTILPCVAAIRLGLNRPAYILYRRMMKQLAAQP